MNKKDGIFFDAGLLIGALAIQDSRHTEALPIVEAARCGELNAYTSVGILSEVYASLTWVGSKPQFSPNEASSAIKRLIELPSKITIVGANLQAAIKTFDLASKYSLTARRTHDARHAATAIVSGISQVFTYDVNDWKIFEPDGIKIVGPPSALKRMSRTSE